ncbi:hypothetical protein [Arthrobacter globiformis]|uniref:hypothetical protein n=1 Tax=Arthrobacter globiformis TaxID=1665 RepID=UPI000B40C728|nr:hypothetical protein [Arthrobacter globiformis]
MVANVVIWGALTAMDMQKLVLKEIDLRHTIPYIREHPAPLSTAGQSTTDAAGPRPPSGLDMLNRRVPA